MLFDDGSQEALPRAAITGIVVFLLEDGGPETAISGDIVVSPSRLEALAASAGTVVVPDPDLAGPGSRHSWPDLLNAALFDAGLKKGRPLEDFADRGFSDAIAARDRVRALSSGPSGGAAHAGLPEGIRPPGPRALAGGSPARRVPQSRRHRGGQASPEGGRGTVP